MSPDDIPAEGHEGDPQGLNLYSYVQGNPINAVDPDGHDCVFALGNSAYVKAGDCSGLPNGAQNATYVAGTVDKKSGKYDSNTGSLSFDYIPYPNSGGLIGKGVVGGIQPTHPGLTEFEKFASALADGDRQVKVFIEQVAINAGGRLMAEGIALSLEAAAAEGEGTLVIGKMNPDGTLRDGTLGPGERTLNLPNQGSPKLNWAQNSSKLRQAMSEGKPIRDASAGNPGSNTGFLRAERNLLQNHGWTLRGEYWYPPSR